MVPARFFCCADNSVVMLDAIVAVFLGMMVSKQSEPRVLITLEGVLFLGRGQVLLANEDLWFLCRP